MATAVKTFKTSIDIPADVRAKMIDLINQQLADTFDLLSQVKQAHWNVKGSDFIQLHKLFDAFAEHLVEYVDLVAERAAMLGGYVKGTARMAAANSTLPEYPTDAVKGLDHVKALSDRYTLYCASTRKAIETADEHNEPTTADLFTEIFGSNEKWASTTAQQNPNLFPKLATGQSPEILWIGCSDSRCPETTVLGLQPGDIFVARNIANIVHATDLNLNSVIEYAVVYLGVKHIVVCGHTQCGGIAAALGNKKLGLIDTWLLPLRSLRQNNLKLLQSLEPKEAALKLVELNIERSVNVLKQNPVIIDAIAERDLAIHPLLYDVGSGKLRELDLAVDQEKDKAREEAFKVVP